MNQPETLLNTQLFILDSDGTLHNGNTVIDGARDLIDTLNAQRREYVIATNSVADLAKEKSQKYERMGLSIPEERIVTSPECLAAYLAQLQQSFNREYLPFVFGDATISQALRNKRISVIDGDGTGANAVVAGGKLHIDVMGEAATALNVLVRNDGEYFATNDDDYSVARDGALKTGTGFLVHGLAKISGKEPMIAGKPHTTMIRQILDRFLIPSHKAVIIGDNPDTDMATAQRWKHTYGEKLPACLVQTGVPKDDDTVRNIPHIDNVVPSVKEIAQLLRRS